MLESRRERIENELSDRVAAFRSELQPVTLQAVQAAIPADAVLIDYLVYRPFDPRAERNADAYGPPHYAAYAFRRTGTPTGVDLGLASEIDRRVAALREGLRDRECVDLRARAQALNEKILSPVSESIGDAARLLISPDGELNLVPFEALVDRSGHYLLERYSVSYLTTGRDLLRMATCGCESRPSADHCRSAVRGSGSCEQSPMYLPAARRHRGRRGCGQGLVSAGAH